jgi:hypothetical protein
MSSSMADRASVASASITHEILQATLVLRFIQVVQGKPRRPHYSRGDVAAALALYSDEAIVQYGGLCWTLCVGKAAIQKVQLPINPLAPRGVKSEPGPPMTLGSATAAGCGWSSLMRSSWCSLKASDRRHAVRLNRKRYDCQIGCMIAANFVPASLRLRQDLSAAKRRHVVAICGITFRGAAPVQDPGTADPRPLLVICATQHTGVLCCALQHGSKKAT